MRPPSLWSSISRSMLSSSSSKLPSEGWIGGEDDRILLSSSGSTLRGLVARTPHTSHDRPAIAPSLWCCVPWGGAGHTYGVQGSRREHLVCGRGGKGPLLKGGGRHGVIYSHNNSGGKTRLSQHTLPQRLEVDCRQSRGRWTPDSPQQLEGGPRQVLVSG